MNNQRNNKSEMKKFTTKKILDRLKELGDTETEKRYKRLNYTQYYQNLIEYENEEKAVCLDSLPLCIEEDEWTFL